MVLNFDNLVMKDNLTVKENLKIEEIKRYYQLRYTPDFVNDKFIIECKGRANESFPMRWKLFKRMINRCNDHM